jgi:hypothetical protein
MIRATAQVLSPQYRSIQTGESMQRSLFTIAIMALSLALPSVACSQANIPSDIGAPAADAGDPDGRTDIPTRLDSVVLPEVQFLFDGLLDPDRISLIESVTAANLDDVRLTTAARSLIRNHLIAMQQVELAIRFLQANRDSILSGNNTSFNSIFGNPGSLREVAVVNPTPLSGMASVRTSMTAGLIELMFRDNDIPNLPAQLKVGDFVFVGDAPNNDPDGFIMEVEQVMFDVDGADQSAMGTSTFGGALTTRNRGMVPVYKVITFEQRTASNEWCRHLRRYVTHCRDWTLIWLQLSRRRTQLLISVDSKISTISGLQELHRLRRSMTLFVGNSIGPA